MSLLLSTGGTRGEDHRWGPVMFFVTLSGVICYNKVEVLSRATTLRWM